MSRPFFSVCIPNYNYKHYLPLTVCSVLGQSSRNLEILFSDNASTDGSYEWIQSVPTQVPIVARRNARNLGFAPNLRQAAEMASGRFMVMLSSDDLMKDSCIETYEQLAEKLGDEAERGVFCSSTTVVDSEGCEYGFRRMNARLWAGAVTDDALSGHLGVPVMKIPARMLLTTSLKLLRSPFYFVSTVYPRSLHDACGGYQPSGLMNPDKQFAWNLLSVAETAYFIDTPLFAYRVHNQNQNAQQRESKALKHLIDQYTYTFGLNPKITEAGGVTNADLARTFIHEDVALRGLKLVAEGDRATAARYYSFGRAAYPDLIDRDRYARALRALLGLGPLSTALAKRAYSYTQRKGSNAGE